MTAPRRGRGADLEVGAQFANAVAAKDRDALLGLLHPNVEFEAMTPRRSWVADTATGLVDDIIFGRWFEATDVIETLEHVDTATVGTRHRVTYRLHIRTSGAPVHCEQTAYFDLTDGRISWMRLLCSGLLPHDQAEPSGVSALAPHRNKKDVK